MDDLVRDDGVVHQRRALGEGRWRRVVLRRNASTRCLIGPPRKVHDVSSALTSARTFQEVHRKPRRFSGIGGPSIWRQEGSQSAVGEARLPDLKGQAGRSRSGCRWPSDWSWPSWRYAASRVDGVLRVRRDAHREHTATPREPTRGVLCLSSSRSDSHQSAWEL